MVHAYHAFATQDGKISQEPKLTGKATSHDDGQENATLDIIMNKTENEGHRQ